MILLPFLLQIASVDADRLLKMCATDAKEGMKRLPTSEQPLARLVCQAYDDGYDDGSRETFKSMSIQLDELRLREAERELHEAATKAGDSASSGQ